jgi:hypothetical protein
MQFQGSQDCGAITIYFAVKLLTVSGHKCHIYFPDVLIFMSLNVNQLFGYPLCDCARKPSSV